mmetsp:Transcript_28112/g.110554  ORF Transcript_28112/g.110554 Transcript_28112/m.110554 type:complete len:205 (-) Transcript_28112:1372-1986(-)
MTTMATTQCSASFSMTFMMRSGREYNVLLRTKTSMLPQTLALPIHRGTRFGSFTRFGRTFHHSGASASLRNGTSRRHQTEKYAEQWRGRTRKSVPEQRKNSIKCSEIWSLMSRSEIEEFRNAERTWSESMRKNEQQAKHVLPKANVKRHRGERNGKLSKTKSWSMWMSSLSKWSLISQMTRPGKIRMSTTAPLAKSDLGRRRNG